MTLRQLTLSVSILAASLMLAAPAQAETWSCSYNVAIRAKPISFVRTGNKFSIPSMKTEWPIIHENTKVIHATQEVRLDTVPIYVLALFKGPKRFALVHVGETADKQNPSVSTWVGTCIIY